MAKEEEQVSKIRELVKKRNMSRNKMKAPHAKRRKLETGFDNTITNPEPNIQEKRKADDPEIGTEAKRMRKIDIREILKKQEEEKETIEERKEASQTEDQAEQPECAANKGDGVYYGDTETVELIDWEETFRQHLEETARMEKERQKRIEGAEKQEKSWELLRECVGYIKENEKAWKREEEEKLTERQKKEQKNKLKQAEKKQKEKETDKQMQQKITESWKRIPEHERRHLLKEEEKRRRMELREVKINVWKRWRK